MDTNLSPLTELMTYIDSVRQKMEVVVAETDSALEIYAGWTIKDVIGHITAWEIVIHKAIQAFSAGDPPYFLREQDFDVFNQNAVDFRASWTLEEVLEEWQDIRAGLRKSIEGLAPDSLNEELVLPWGSERTLTELIEILGEHESEHMEHITKLTG